MVNGLALVGVSHHTAPVEIRERFAFSRSEAVRVLERLRSEAGIGESILLSTCNRTELYAFPITKEDHVQTLRTTLASQATAGVSDPEAYLYELRGDAVAGHLFRVSSGLESMILGEMEIQGQVREAYRHANELAPPSAGPVLHRLFQSALSVGGQIRSDTHIGEGAASVASVSVKLAEKVFGALEGRRALVLGAGKNAALVMEALARRGVEGAVVANRTYDRAVALAERVGARAISMERMHDALRESDIVIASTAAPHPVLTRDRLHEALPGGASRSMLFIDIAIPRDIEPSVGDEPNVFLYNIDDLMRIADENLSHRGSAVEAAESIIERRTAQFNEWLLSQEVVPMIRALRDRAEVHRAAEVERLLRKMENRSGTISDDERGVLEEFSRRLLNKILHTPTTRLKDGVADGRGSGFLDAARFLYDLSIDEPEREGFEPDGGPDE